MTAFREAPTSDGARIAAALDDTLGPLRLARKDIGDALRVVHQKQYTTTSSEMTVPIFAGWKLASWSFGAGVALLGSPPESTQAISELSATVERQIAERLGYVTFWKPLALNLVWCATGLLDRTRGLAAPMELATRAVRSVTPMGAIAAAAFPRERQVSDSRVNIVSITAVDLTAKRVIGERHPRAGRSAKFYAAIQAALEGLVAR